MTTQQQNNHSNIPKEFICFVIIVVSLLCVYYFQPTTQLGELTKNHERATQIDSERRKASVSNPPIENDKIDAKRLQRLKPRRTRGGTKTDSGTYLFAYGVPRTEPSSVMSVAYRYYSASEKKFESVLVPIESVDVRTRMSMKSRNRKCNKEPSDKVAACFQKVMADSLDLLFETITGNLRLLPTMLANSSSKSVARMYDRDQKYLFGEAQNPITPSSYVEAQIKLRKNIDEFPPKRAYFDIGSRNWESGSTSWFLSKYPMSSLFDEAYAFEMDRRFKASFDAVAINHHFFKNYEFNSSSSSSPAGSSSSSGDGITSEQRNGKNKKTNNVWKFMNKAVWIHQDGIEWNGADMGVIRGIVGGDVAAPTQKPTASPPKATGFENNNNNDVDKSGSNSQNQVVNSQKNAETTTRLVPSLDFAKFLLDNYREEDYLVLKMDIEGAEWQVLERMIDTGAIYLVDEMFLECHVNKERTPGMHPKCVDLINLLRKMGVFCHRWV